MKSKVLFFARDYQADLMVFLTSEKYESIFVTLTLSEKKKIEKKGFKVAGCFEEEFDALPVYDFPESYLETSFSADRYLRYASISERRTILGKEISFWNNLLDAFKPTLVVNEMVAIEMSEVLHLQSKQKGIRYLAWMSFSLKNHFYWLSSPLHNRLDHSVFDVAPDADSLEKAQSHINNVQNKDGRPFYVSNVRGRYSLYDLAKNIYWTFRCLLTENKYSNKAKNLAIFGSNTGFYIERIKAFFNSFFFRYDDLKKFEKYEFVFFPLHYEPEAVLFYMAEFFDNQVCTIENIAKCLKHNQVLVVKEHPQQAGALLQHKFRSLKNRVSNIVYLPGEYSTYHLIKKSKIVVTLASTAGIEALILGKPVAVLGKVFYDQYENVNSFDNYNDLKTFMRDEKLWKCPDMPSLKKFLAALISYCQKGNPFPHAELYSKENIENIISAIEKELHREKERDLM